MRRSEDFKYCAIPCMSLLVNCGVDNAASHFLNRIPVNRLAWERLRNSGRDFQVPVLASISPEFISAITKGNRRGLSDYLVYCPLHSVSQQILNE